MLASETLATGLIRTFLCGNKFKLKKRPTRTLPGSDNATSLSLELVNVDHNANTFGNRGFFGIYRSHSWTH